MKVRQKSFFDEENRMEKISKIGDPLEMLNKVIKWEMFRTILKKAVVRKETTGKGGRPPYDVVMMFKILVLQRLYNLSDDQTEYQINDRRSFMRFLGFPFVQGFLEMPQCVCRNYKVLQCPHLVQTGILEFQDYHE